MIWWWSFSSVTLGDDEFPFTAITTTLIQSGNSCKEPIYGSNRTEHLSLPPTRLDLVQGLFFIAVFLEKGTILVIGSVGAMGSRWPCWDLDSLNAMWVRRVCLLIGWTKLISLVLYCAVNEAGGGHSASNLSLTLNPMRHECQTAWLKSRCSENECPSQTNRTV